MKFRTIFVLWFLFFASAALAEPQKKVSHEYYDIRGSTPQDLRREMDEKGILGNDGHRYDAHTSWHVRWSYKYKRVFEGCDIATVETNVEVKYRLPRWVNSSQASLENAQRWNEYMTALMTHESGHENFGVSAARDIESSIRNMEPSDNCDALGQKANQLGDRILDRYRAEETVYDAKTNHGATQGARFP